MSMFEVPASIFGEQNPEYQRQYRTIHANEIRTYQSRWRKTSSKYNPLTPKHYREMLRSLLIQRDKVCGFCGLVVELKDASPDHIIPRSRGGGNEATNIRLAHRTCNMKHKVSKLAHGK
jgi:5-methylcytosine-specific restriction endonuclease McrA